MAKTAVSTAYTDPLVQFLLSEETLKSQNAADMDPLVAFLLDGTEEERNKEKARQTEIQKIGKENLEKRGEFTRGVARGTDTLQASLYGFAGLAGSGLGIESLKQWGFEGYKRNLEEAQQNPASVQFEDLALTEPMKAARWAWGTLGELAPSMAEALVSGLAGAAIGTAAAPGAGTATGALAGFLGKRAMRKMVEEAAESYVKKGIAKEAAQTFAEKEVASMAQNALVKIGMRTAGAQTGVFAGVMPMEAGGNWGETLQEKGIDNPVSALATGTVAAFLELAGGNSRLIGKVLGPAKETAFRKAVSLGDTRLVARAAKEALISGGGEYAQEFGQEFLSLVNTAVNDPTFELYTQENLKRLNQAGWTGFVGGAAGGTIGGAKAASIDATAAREKANLYGKMADSAQLTDPILTWKKEGVSLETIYNNVSGVIEEFNSQLPQEMRKEAPTSAIAELVDGVLARADQAGQTKKRAGILGAFGMRAKSEPGGMTTGAQGVSDIGAAPGPDMRTALPPPGAPPAGGPPRPGSITPSATPLHQPIGATATGVDDVGEGTAAPKIQLERDLLAPVSAETPAADQELRNRGQMTPQQEQARPEQIAMLQELDQAEKWLAKNSAMKNTPMYRANEDRLNQLRKALSLPSAIAVEAPASPAGPISPGPPPPQGPPAILTQSPAVTPPSPPAQPSGSAATAPEGPFIPPSVETTPLETGEGRASAPEEIVEPGATSQAKQPIEAGRRYDPAMSYDEQYATYESLPLVERLRWQYDEAVAKNAPDTSFEHIYRGSGEQQKNLPKKGETWKQRADRVISELEKRQQPIDTGRVTPPPEIVPGAKAKQAWEMAKDLSDKYGADIVLEEAERTAPPAKPVTQGVTTLGARPKSKDKTGTKEQKKPKDKGPINLVTRITTPDAQGRYGMKFGKDYNTKEARQFLDLKRVSNQKTGLSPDEWATILNSEGYISGTGEAWTSDSLIKVLKTGAGRNIFTPEKRDVIVERQIERKTNEWADEQAAIAAEGMDPRGGEKSRSNLAAEIVKAAREQGEILTEAEALAELDDFPFEIKEGGSPSRDYSSKGGVAYPGELGKIYEPTLKRTQFKNESDELLGPEPMRLSSPRTRDEITRHQQVVDSIPDKPWEWMADDLMDLRPSERQAKLEKIWGPEEDLDNFRFDDIGPAKRRYWAEVDSAADLDRAIIDGNKPEVAAILRDIQEGLDPWDYYAYEIQNPRGDTSVPTNAGREARGALFDTSRTSAPTKPLGDYQESLPGLSDRETFTLSNPTTKIGTLKTHEKGQQTAGMFEAPRETEKGVEMYSAETKNPPKHPALRPGEVNDLVGSLVESVKGIAVRQTEEGNWIIKTKSGQAVEVVAVEQISPTEIEIMAMEKAWGVTPDAASLQGKRIAGAYTPKEKRIRLVKNAAGAYTITHEFEHFLEDIGAIGKADILILQQKIRYLHAQGKLGFAPAISDQVGGAEDRAKWIARQLAGIYDAKTTTGKILQKIREIIDRIVNALGGRTAGGVVRDIKAGGIYDRGLKATEESDTRFSVTSEKGTGNIPAKETPSPEAGTLKDSTGNTLVLYHGTDNPGFDVFKPGWREPAIFLTPVEENAWKYAKGVGTPSPTARVEKMTIDMRNPLIVDGRTGTNDLYPLTEAKIKELETQGYDGIVALGPSGKIEHSREIIPFHSEQIKRIPPETTPKPVGGRKYYHGTDQSFDTLDFGKRKAQGAWGVTASDAKVIFLSEKSEDAEFFAKWRGTGEPRIVEVPVSNSAKILDLSLSEGNKAYIENLEVLRKMDRKAADSIDEGNSTVQQELESQKFVDRLKKNGYAGIRFDEAEDHGVSVGIFNKDAIVSPKPSRLPEPVGGIREKTRLFKSYGAEIRGDKVILYRGGDVSKKILSDLRYGDHLSAAKTGLDTTGNEGATGYGKNVVRFELPLSDVEVTGAGEFQYKGQSKSLTGGNKYPTEIYRAYNDYFGSNYTAKEIDAQSDVRSVASMALSGGREEFDALMKDHIPPETTPKPVGGIPLMDKSLKEHLSNPNDFINALDEHLYGSDDAVILRGLYKDEVGKKTLKSSSVWEDGKRTNEKLKGTSGVIVSGTWDNDPASVIKDNLSKYASSVTNYGDSDYIAVIKGKLETGEIFNDPGEAVVSNPKVVAYIKKSSLPNPSRPSEGGGQSAFSLEGLPEDTADAAYLNAVKKGDMETAQKMVNEAAKKWQSYDTFVSPRKKLYHGTREDFTVFDLDAETANIGPDSGVGFMFTERRATATSAARRFARGEGPMGGRVVSAYIKIKNPMEFDGQEEWFDYVRGFADTSDVRVDIIDSGHDGVVVWNADVARGVEKDATEHWWVAIDPMQIKSADPVTRDDKGKVIPLSERFNEGTPDIRYSLEDLPADTAGRINEMAATLPAETKAQAAATGTEAATTRPPVTAAAGTKAAAPTAKETPATEKQPPSASGPIGQKAEEIWQAAFGAAGTAVNRGVASLGAGRISPETKQSLARFKQHWQEFWSPFSTMPEGKQALAARYKSMGDVAKAMRFLEGLHAQMDPLPDDVKKDMFRYLDGQVPLEVLPAGETRQLAEQIRQRTRTIGLAMVERSILTQEQFDSLDGRYIHYMYAYHILGDSAKPGSIATGNNGKLDLSETMRRNPNLTMEQRRALGLIEDASIAVPVGMGKALTDIAKWDYLHAISSNPDWVWQPSFVSLPLGKEKKDGTKRMIRMTVGKLAEETRIYAKMVKEHPSPEVEAHYKILKDAFDKAQAETRNIPEDFVQLPESKHYGELSGAFVRKPIADDLKPVLGQIDQDTGKLARLFWEVEQQSVATFKMGKVALNVPTAFRNVMSNIIQMNMRGRSLPGVMTDIVRALESYKAKDAFYEEAYGMGLFHSNWFTEEIGAILDEFKKAQSGNLFKVMQAVRWLAKYYGRIDDFSKLAIFRQMRESGASVDEAALEAMKWGMDYSLASRSVKGLRRHIIPFGTYQYKIAGLIAESLAKRPWVIAKYMALPAIARAVAMSLNDLDDDDWDALEKQLPAYIKKSGSVIIMPWKTEKGQWQWLNTEYFMPFGNWMNVFRGAAKGDIGEFLQDLGVSHPLVDLFTMFRTARDGQPPTSPWMGKTLYNELDTPVVKAAKMLEHIAFTFAPSMLSPSYGALGHTISAVKGGEDRWGKEVSIAQAAARWFGFNVVTVSPEQTAAIASVRLSEMQKELSRIKADPRNSEEEKKAAETRMREKIAEMAEKTPAAVLPIRKQKGADPVYDGLVEMIRSGNLKSAPPSRTVEIGGIIRKMSLDQYRGYLDKSSDLAHPRLERLFASDGWETMTDKRKGEVVSSIITNARKTARQKVKVEIGKEIRAEKAKGNATVTAATRPAAPSAFGTVRPKLTPAADLSAMQEID